MGRWIVLLLVIAAVILAIQFRPRGDGGSAEQGQPTISAELQDQLYTPYITLNIAETGIHDFTSNENEFGSRCGRESERISYQGLDTRENGMDVKMPLDRMSSALAKAAMTAHTEARIHLARRGRGRTI